MKRESLVVGAVALLLANVVPAANVRYWVCVDQHGVKEARDHACDPDQQTLSAPAGYESHFLSPQSPRNELSNPKPATAQVYPIRSQSHRPPINLFAPIEHIAVVGFLWIIGLLAFITIVKIMFAGGGWRRVGRLLRGIQSGDDNDHRDWSPPGASDRDRVAPGVGLPPNHWDLSLIRALEWKRFEELCEGLWRARGYVARQTGPGPDGGIDVLVEDPDAPDRLLAVIQCKSWRNQQVGVESVRALWGARDHFSASRAAFYSVSGFTKDAMDFSQGKALELVSGEQLLTQIQSLSDDAQALMLADITRGDYITPSCPSCNLRMVQKTDKGGKADYWSCPRFPFCRSERIWISK